MKTKMRTIIFKEQIAQVLLIITQVYISIRSIIEIYNIAWGTGLWLGEFSLKWGLLFFVYILFCISLWIVTVLVFWKQDTLKLWNERIISFRKKLGAFRWLIALALLIFPIWFLQYSPWGIVFSGKYFRIFIWIYVVLGLAVFFQTNKRLLTWSSLLAALIITTSTFAIAAALVTVTDYPFSLSWSEGNRLWDYSLLFGRDLYNYPTNVEITSPTDEGRQLVSGLPFLLPLVSIVTERLWVGLATVIPYVLLGFAVFRTEIKNKILWILLALFTFIFLKQGPIHPPLLVIAFVVALSWRRPLWLAMPLIFIASYLAEASRYTWLFAPGIWIVMLEFSGALLKEGRLEKFTWWRAASLGLSGVVGGYFGRTLVNWFKALFTFGESAPFSGGAVSVSSITSSVSTHPLFWYRLLPNATYGPGILIALVIAVFPLVTLLVYLSVTKKWVLNTWQKLTLVLPLFALLVVGLIVSTKAGGGGDLHNLDMFLIGLLFTGVISWENGGRQWLSQIETYPVWTKWALALLLIIPGIQPLSALRSIHFAEDSTWLVTLTDVSDDKFLELLPSQEEVDEILSIIIREVDAAKLHGEVLFIDQRQLLTFGYVEDIVLVPEYEKKVLMNQAMADNAAYFDNFYSDLAAKRFSLIVSEPLRAPAKDSGFKFGEESNAWVKWIVYPVLCYYEPIETFRNVQIQLLVPGQGDVDCSSELPEELQD